MSITSEIRNHVRYMMDRKQLIHVLQNIACIQCYDSESDQTLRDAVLDSIRTGDISVEDLK